MKKTIQLLLCVTILAAAGCSQQKDKYAAFAEDFCTCMKPMAEFQKEIMTMMSEGKQEEIMGMLERGQKIDEDGQACMAELEKKHGRIEGEEAETKAMEALRKTCPDIMALMEESAAPGPAPEDFLEEEMLMPEAEGGQ